jgi:hypothetical protein
VVHAFRKLPILSAVTLIYFPTAGRAADSATDTASIELRMAENDWTSDSVPCSQWAGRKAKITF